MGSIKKGKNVGGNDECSDYLGDGCYDDMGCAAIVCNYGLISSYCSPSMEKRHESFVPSNEW